jgi:hypothetical protein
MEGHETGSSPISTAGFNINGLILRNVLVDSTMYRPVGTETSPLVWSTRTADMIRDTGIKRIVL